jgi:hypothetical protein
MCLGGSSTTTQTTEPFSGERNDRFNDLYSYLQNRLQSPQTYSGPLTTPTNAATQQGIGGLTNAAKNQILQDYATGKFVDLSANPYLQNEINALKQNSVDLYSQLAAAIDTRLANRGFWDSSPHASALTSAANQANRNFNDTVANLENTAYQQGIGNMLSAQGQLQDANSALANAGNSEWSQQNSNLDRQYQVWKDQMGLSGQDISNLLNYFNLGKNPTTTQTQEADGGLGAILGSVLGGLSSAWGKKPLG